MHISEGVLTPQVLVTGAAIAAAGTAVGLKKMDYDHIPKIAVLTAAFFVASLIHVPVGPASVHLTLNGLLGLMLGWAAFPAILIGLLLQALLFQFGGLTVLGVNAVNMGLPALIVYLLFGYFIKKDNAALTIVCSFLAGSVAVLLSILFTAFSLLFSGQEFINIVKIMVIAHIPVVIIEGVVNTFIVTLLKKVKPEILEFSRAIADNA
jgi:cobalt/nickel transport system permease protein